MILRTLLPVLCLASLPALAEDAAPIARWGEDSGSLPPEYAWDYMATFTDDRRVSVTYCKGYEETPPGCATVTRRLSKAKYASLVEALAPLLPAIAANPPQDSADPMVGGGSFHGAVFFDGAAIRLPGDPREEDAARVAEVLEILRNHTPGGAITAARTQAKAP